MVHFIYSLPAHEKIEVLVDQINNTNKFNSRFSIRIVLHLSQRFVLSTSEIEILSALPNVLINPERLLTGFMDGSLYEAHLSNISFVYSQQIEFGHIIFLASNLMFVKQMAILKSDFIGSSHDAILHKGWYQGWMAIRDSNINHFHLYGCQIEGLFISKALLDKMFPYLKKISYKQLFTNSDVVKRNSFWAKVFRQFRKKRFSKWVKTDYPLKPKRWLSFGIFPFARIAYATEEVYFSTIARLFEKEFIFSGKEISFQDWKNSNIVTVESITWLRESGQTDYVCTKRVDRIYDDPIRTYIRNLPLDLA
jgi:hypothetical protein